MDCDTFILLSLDGIAFSMPRECTFVARIADDHRDDYMLVQLDEVVPGAQFGLETDISRVLLAAKHRGVSLFEAPEWPAHVYVAHCASCSEHNRRVHAGEITLLAWAELRPINQRAS